MLSLVMIVEKLSGLFQTGMVAAPLTESMASMLLNQVIYTVLKSFKINLFYDRRNGYSGPEDRPGGQDSNSQDC